MFCSTDAERNLINVSIFSEYLNDLHQIYNSINADLAKIPNNIMIIALAMFEMVRDVVHFLMEVCNKCGDIDIKVGQIKKI